MVDERGQLYTIEGVAAGMIMLFTTYLVLSATSVYTPGDTHISDMQLEQIGTDALKMMNTPVNGTAKSTLTEIVETSRVNAIAADETFNTTFLKYVNERTGSESDNLHYMADVTYRSDLTDNSITSYQLACTHNRIMNAGDHPVRVTEWVIADKQFPGSVNHPRAVLVEVLLWRD